MSSLSLLVLYCHYEETVGINLSSSRHRRLRFSIYKWECLRANETNIINNVTDQTLTSLLIVKKTRLSFVYFNDCRPLELYKEDINPIIFIPAEKTPQL